MTNAEYCNDLDDARRQFKLQFGDTAVTTNFWKALAQWLIEERG